MTSDSYTRTYARNKADRVVTLPFVQLEMEIPKTLWLKNHMKPELFARCNFFDLPDYRESSE